MYIIFEGMGGSGKTCMASRLHKYFVDKHEPALFTFEPGFLPKVREILLNKPEMKTLPEAQFYLFMADRIANDKLNVGPALAKGFHVVQDRNIISTLVYQGLEEGLGPDRIYEEYTRSCSSKPDHIVLFDLDEKVAYARLLARGKQHKFNQLGIDDLCRRREYYLQCATHYFKDQLIVLNSDNPVEVTFKNLLKELGMEEL
jgi:dTMP kinase